MNELIQAILRSDEKTDLRQLLSELRAKEKRYLLRNEILQAFGDCCYQSQKQAYFYHASSLGKLIHYTHEILLEAESTWFLVRSKVASHEVWRLGADLSSVELMDTTGAARCTRSRCQPLPKPHPRNRP